MGVNLEASGLMLPTTKLALALKSARGRKSDMVSPSQQELPTTDSWLRSSLRGGTRAVRLVMWLAEEWFRQLVAEYYQRRGYIVLFDRHFYADYYHSDVAAQHPRSVVS